MKYAIMSDVHSNPLALATALADARKRRCEKFVFLGDVCGYGYDVKSALEMVRSNFDVVLLGNHDAIAAKMDERASALLNHNYDIDRAQSRELSAAEKEWFRTLPYQHDDQEGGFSCVHGDFVAPEKWDYVIDDCDAAYNFSACSHLLMFCAHSHHATLWTLAKDARTIYNPMEQQMRHPAVKAESVSLKLKRGCRYIINCGSIGHPRHDLCSTYAIFDSELRQVTIRRLPFNFRDYVKSMLMKGLRLPNWMVEVLRAASNGK